MSRSKNNFFLSGNTFDGIVVTEISDAQYNFSIEGKKTNVTQYVECPKSDRICLCFFFKCQVPTRFRIDVKIPNSCKNAFVSLNDQKLIGYFSADIPEDPEYYVDSTCKTDLSASTLKPGEYQSLNFLWQSGDILKFFFYY